MHLEHQQRKTFVVDLSPALGGRYAAPSLACPLCAMAMEQQAVYDLALAPNSAWLLGATG